MRPMLSFSLAPRALDGWDAEGERAGAAAEAVRNVRRVCMGRLRWGGTVSNGIRRCGVREASAVTPSGAKASRL